MKKFCFSVILFFMLFGLNFSFAGYDPGMQMQQEYEAPYTYQNDVDDSHWYFEMSIAAGALTISALGLWLKYKKK